MLCPPKPLDRPKPCAKEVGEGWEGSLPTGRQVKNLM